MVIVQVTSAMFLVLEAKLAVSKIWDMWTESHNTDGWLVRSLHPRLWLANN